MSKEKRVLELFFNEPTKHWHFEEVLKFAKISRPQGMNWLKKFRLLGLIKRIKPKGEMPYYVANYERPEYQSKKQLYALNMLEEQGFLTHLTGLTKAHTIILFGSLSRWDWHRDSDIDIFILGDPEGFNKQEFRSKLHREIETFVCRNKQELSHFNPALLRNIAEGYLVKGNLDFLERAYA